MAVIRDVLAHRAREERVGLVTFAYLLRPARRVRLDPAEIEFPFDDASSFEDLESGEQMPVVPDALREQYRAMIREHIAALTTKSAEQRVDYNLLNTSVPLDYALFNYLSQREKLSRVR